jgi:hypothetical protein
VNDNNQEFLEHVGVLGMKWGVHRTRRGATTKPHKKVDAKTKQYIPSEDYKRKVSLKKKKIYEMSNADLKELNGRLQLEKQYKELNPKKVNKGLKIIKQLTAAGTTIASLYALLNTPLGQDITKIVKSKLNES